MKFLKKLSKKQLIIGGLIGVGLIGLWKYDQTYIINPYLELYRGIPWASLEDKASYKITHDPKWFVMPPEKYLAKEVPFNWNKYFFSDALKRRNAYFVHLCETEGRNYTLENIPKTFKSSLVKRDISVFNAGDLDFPVKKEAINLNFLEKNDQYTDPINRKLEDAALQNPYVWSRGINFPPTKKVLEKFNGTEITNNFTETMYGDGSIYREMKDDHDKLISMKKLNNENEVQARYTMLTKELPVRNDYMKNLGIHEIESIIYDRQEKRLLSYYHDFIMATYLDSTRGSGQNTLIKWANAVTCYPIKESIIKDFN